MHASALRREREPTPHPPARALEWEGPSEAPIKSNSPGVTTHLQAVGICSDNSALEAKEEDGHLASRMSRAEISEGSGSVDNAAGFAPVGTT